MWPFPVSSRAYRAVPNQQADDEDESIDLENEYKAFTPQRTWFTSTVFFLTLASTAAVAIFLLFISQTIFRDTANRYINDTIPAETRACPRRLAWHTLTTDQKSHYISSVRCLLNHPTTLPLNTQPVNHTSLYSDFPYIHSHLGYATHHVAPFLPWHRYFLHIYETALRTKCGYKGEGLVYWEWTAEWDDLPHSAVFDPDTGFGGDGDRAPGAAITAGNNGRCLTDGPFKDIVANFYDIKYQPHCLSRGFRDDQGTRGVIDGSMLAPESVEDVMQAETYEDFVHRMEERLHDVIPFGVGGDFETFTAPYDPLFYLHHTQLDRLWWQWQQRNPTHLRDYGGPKKRHSIERAHLTDLLNYGGLDGMHDVEVAAVMDPQEEGGVLCYRY